MVDMSPAAIAGRLQRVAKLNLEAEKDPAWQAEQARRLAVTWSEELQARTDVNMSGEAIAGRLREASELLTVCQHLGQVGPRQRTTPEQRSDRNRDET